MTSGLSIALFATFEKTRRKSAQLAPAQTSRKLVTKSTNDSPRVEASLPLELVATLSARSIPPQSLLSVFGSIRHEFVSK